MCEAGDQTDQESRSTGRRAATSVAAMDITIHGNFLAKVNDPDSPVARSRDRPYGSSVVAPTCGLSPVDRATVKSPSRAIDRRVPDFPFTYPNNPESDPRLKESP